MLGMIPTVTPAMPYFLRLFDVAWQQHANEIAVVLLGVDEGSLEHRPVHADADGGELGIAVETTNTGRLRGVVIALRVGPTGAYTWQDRQLRGHAGPVLLTASHGGHEVPRPRGRDRWHTDREAPVIERFDDEGGHQSVIELGEGRLSGAPADLPSSSTAR
jgi:hypothetical protein